MAWSDDPEEAAVSGRCRRHRHCARTACGCLIRQRDTGGNMVELLSNLSDSIRQQHKLKRKVSALSAQGRLSAAIIIAVPFVLALLMYFMIPEPVVGFVTNPIGMLLLGISGTWMAIGVVVLYKIVNIEV